jgi:hypothetical protein
MHAWVMVMERLAVLLNCLYVISVIRRTASEIARAYLVVVLHTKQLDPRLDSLSHGFLHYLMLTRVVQLM